MVQRKKLLSLQGFVLLVCMLFGIVLNKPTTTYACSCIVPDRPSKTLSNSTAVFAGQVTAIDRPIAGSIVSSADKIAVTFRVTQVWKGPAYKTQWVRTAQSGVSCGYEGFHVGDEYLVYASGTVEDLQTSLCSRTKPYVQAQMDLDELGTGTAPTLDNPYDPRLRWIAIAIVGLGLIGVTLIVRRVVTARRRLAQSG